VSGPLAVALGAASCHPLQLPLILGVDPREAREATLERTIKKLRETLGKTKMGSAKMIGVAARPGGADSKEPSIGLDELRATISDMTVGENGVPARTDQGLFRFAIDHCFQIRGQGTILTGTCLSVTPSSHSVTCGWLCLTEITIRVYACCIPQIT
jgi:hypothetical protein